jgi:hypothetical protein
MEDESNYGDSYLDEKKYWPILKSGEAECLHLSPSDGAGSSAGELTGMSEGLLRLESRPPSA